MSEADSETSKDVAFLTPAWLERSFVLPTQHRPGHDDLPAPAHHSEPGSRHTRMAATQFVRPASPTVDFARLLRRNHLARTARRTALIGFALMLLAVALTLTAASVITLALLGLATTGTLVGTGVAVALRRTDVPHLHG